MGFFATARQLTEWLEALYTQTPVQIMNEPTPRPIVAYGATYWGSLFGTTAYFSHGYIVPASGLNPAGPPATEYRHNGAWGMSCGAQSGTSNGDMAILVGPGSHLHCAAV